jgi:hypothetical protein
MLTAHWAPALIGVKRLPLVEEYGAVTTAQPLLKEVLGFQAGEEPVEP